MRLDALFISLLLAISNSLAAATVRGVILENEMGGRPLPNVAVSAIEGANPVRSQSNGMFVLDFRNKQPGEQVRLVVQMPGMVVVNEFQLQVTLTKNADAAPLTLLLCKAADREEMARRFHRLPSFSTIEQSYKRRLDELQASNRASEEAKEQLRMERDQAREFARAAAEPVARLTVGESNTSELYRDVIATTYQSDVVAMLNSLGLMYHRLNWIDDAQRAYDEALQIGLELIRENSANPALYAPQVAETLTGLGNMWNDQNRTDEAKRYYEQALAISRKLVQPNVPPGAPRNNKFLPFLVVALNNLGNVFRKQNRPEMARTAFNEALEESLKLTLLLPSDLADMARIQRIARDLESYRNREGLASANYLPDLAMTLRNLGVLDQDQKRIEEARKNIGAALVIYETLARKNAAQYGQEVESTRRLMDSMNLQRP